MPLKWVKTEMPPPKVENPPPWRTTVLGGKPTFSSVGLLAMAIFLMALAFNVYQQDQGTEQALCVVQTDLTEAANQKTAVLKDALTVLTDAVKRSADQALEEGRKDDAEEALALQEAFKRDIRLLKEVPRPSCNQDL